MVWWGLHWINLDQKSGPPAMEKPIRLPILTLTSFLRGIVHTQSLKIRNKKKCDDLSNNPSHHSFWSLAKQITRNFTNSSFPSLFRPGGSVASKSVDKATIFVKKFASNSSLDDSRATPPVNLPLSNHVLPNYFLSTRDVQSALAVLDVRKALWLMAFRQFCWGIAPGSWRLTCVNYFV